MESFDLLVVDRMLPDLEGTQVVKRLRAADIDVPVLMLTVRDQIEDRVEGLDAGADDYLPKPFAFPELLARVRALARRPPEKQAADTVLAVGDVTLDPVRHEVRRGGERIELTAKEFALLATLVQQAGVQRERGACSVNPSERVPHTEHDYQLFWYRRDVGQQRPGRPEHFSTG